MAKTAQPAKSCRSSARWWTWRSPGRPAGHLRRPGDPAGRRRQAGLRGARASSAGGWVRAVAMSSTDGLRRGMHGHRLRASRSRCRSGRARWAASSTSWATAIDTDRAGGRRRLLPHPPPGALSGRAVHQGRGVRDRHQGHRPDRAVHQGRQDGHLRRRGRGQDGRHPGADPQHRQVPLGLLGLRRRGRAQPRGQRPVARDARLGRHQQHRRWSSAR